MKAVHIWGRELGAYARSPLGVVVPAAFLLLFTVLFRRRVAIEYLRAEVNALREGAEGA